MAHIFKSNRFARRRAARVGRGAAHPATEAAVRDTGATGPRVERSGRLALLVPYRDRQRYLDVFARAVPDYLEQVNGIRDYAIYVAEQEDGGLFNLALSRDVAARAALTDGGFDYFVFHDIDIIPMAHIDYGPRAFNVAWFLSAGSCKVRVEDFVRANGYNPAFVGWGDEDVEFYHRLETIGSPVREWHRIAESRAAVAMNLDWPELPDDESLRWSQSYFGHRGGGPRYVTWSRTAHGRPLPPYDKTNGFLEEEQRVRNQALWGRVRSMSTSGKLAYLRENGINRVRLEGARREERGRLRWLRYRTEDVLAAASTPAPEAGPGRAAPGPVQTPKPKPRATPAPARVPAPAAAQWPTLSLPECAEQLTARLGQVFFVQIGAMDGTRFDPLYPLILRHGWTGLLVEPLPDLFAELLETYRARSGLVFENVAVAETEGERTMFRILPRTIADKALPDWAVGISSLFPDKNALGWSDLAPHVVEERVRCLDLPALLAKHRIDRIDVFQIDAAGADLMILAQLDWRRFRPSLIQLEICNLTADEKDACRSLLSGHGYRLAEHHGDLLAAHETLVAPPPSP
jgi:FkbM family methyltransferase